MILHVPLQFAICASWVFGMHLLLPFSVRQESLQERRNRSTVTPTEEIQHFKIAIARSFFAKNWIWNQGGHLNHLNLKHLACHSVFSDD
jgi:hypothetical protein